MSQAPRHSKPVTKKSSSSPSAAALKASSSSVAAAHPAADVGADLDPVGPDRLGVQEVVEARHRLQVGGGHPHHRGGLADPLRGAPAVAPLHRPERRDRGRVAVGVARHQRLDPLPQLRRAVDFVQLRDLLLAARSGTRPSVTRRVDRQVRVAGRRRRRRGSSVDTSEDRVEHAEAGDHVGDVAVDAPCRVKACRLTKEGSRKWTRAGFEEPSARTKQPSSPRGDSIA